MAPLADAMGFIHGDEADVGLVQHLDRSARGEAFRGHIEEFKCASFERAPDVVGFFFCVAGGQRARCNACFFQSTHLIAHEGDEWGNHDSDALAHECGQLEA